MPAFSCPENALSLHIMTAFFREHNTYFNTYNIYFNTYVKQIRKKSNLSIPSIMCHVFELATFNLTRQKK